MPCDTRTLPNQTLSQRKEEVLESIVKLNGLLASGAVKPKIGPQGAITFVGWAEADRGRVSDVCAYRRIMAIGGSLAKAQIAKAEAMAGQTVDRKVIAAGGHYHGDVYHNHKG